MSHKYAAIEQQARASAARIGSRAAELMVEHDDWPVNQCMALALMEEWFLYGNLYEAKSDRPPRGLLGCSPLETLRERGRR